MIIIEKYELVKFIDGEFELEVNVSPSEETIWMTLDEIAILFDRDKSVISIRNNEYGSKASVLRETLFPSTQKIEERYKFIKGRKYLLPVAWVARGFVNLKDIPKKFKYIKSVSNTDMNLVSEYDGFISEIGL